MSAHMTTERAEASFIRLNPEPTPDHEADQAAWMLKLAATKLYAVDSTEPVFPAEAARLVEMAELWIASASRSLARLKERMADREAGL